MMLSVVAVPPDHPDHDELPWEYDEDAFCTWVWEVFLVGYKSTVETFWGPHDEVPVPSLIAAMAVVREAGYTVEIEGSTLAP